MKDDRKVRETLAKIGTLAGVGEDWYEIGDAEYDDVADDNVRYGVYAKSDEIADKVGKVIDKLIADRKTEPQTMVYPQVDGITPSVIKPQTENE